MQKYSSQPIAIKFEKKREGEPSVLVANAAKARQLLQWEPQYSDLPTLIGSAWRWHQWLFENGPLLRSALAAKQP